MEIKNVLVTGGGGFLGKAIVKKLVKKNLAVTSFSRNFYPDLENLGVLQIQGDLADKNAVAKAVRNIDSVRPSEILIQYFMWLQNREYGGPLKTSSR